MKHLVTQPIKFVENPVKEAIRFTGHLVAGNIGYVEDSPKKFVFHYRNDANTLGYIDEFSEEQWRFVTLDGVKDMYEVSNQGRIRNAYNKKILKPYPINSGYLVIRLYTGQRRYNYNTGEYNSIYKSILVHRLVMLMFEPIDNEHEMTVNHKDGNKFNNKIENLEWVTQAENNEHGIKLHKKYGSNNYQAAFTKDQLRVILKELEKGTMYKNILKLIGVEVNDNNCDYIGNIKRGKTYQREIKDILEEDGSSTIES